MSAIPSADHSLSVSGRQPTLERMLTAKGLSSILAAVILFTHLGSALGPMVPVITFGATMTMLVLLRDRADRNMLRFAWLLTLPALALVSTAWSKLPVTTLYYALQFMLSALAALAIWLSGDLRGFIRQMFGASLAICIVSLVSGQTGPSMTGPVLVGITGSKNAMAAAGQCMVLCGVALAADGKQPPIWRLAGALVLPLGGWIVVITQAATIQILTLAAPLFCMGLLALHVCPAKFRPFLSAALLLGAVTGGSFAGKLAQRAEEVTLSTFNKDKGLTGRTYLWMVAREKISDRPWQGYGYKAFWMGESVDSIGLLRSQRIADPRTFSLHQTYLEVWLDLGVPGLVIAAGILALALAMGAYRAVRSSGIPELFCAVSLFCLVVRSFGETLFQPFYAYGTVVMVLAAFSLLGPYGRQSDSRSPATVWRRIYKHVAILR